MLKFDELNVLMNKVRASKKLEEIKETVMKEADDLIGYAYFLGMFDADDQLGTDSVADYMLMEASINKKVEGKDFHERLEEYIAENDADGIEKVLTTEYHRVYNDGAMDTAIKNGAKYKSWVTMGDDRVRETHSFIEGVKVPIDAMFYTDDGDSALQPGGFAKADNNCNCRCQLMFSK